MKGQAHPFVRAAECPLSACPLSLRKHFGLKINGRLWEALGRGIGVHRAPTMTALSDQELWMGSFRSGFSSRLGLRHSSCSSLCLQWHFCDLAQTCCIRSGWRPRPALLRHNGCTALRAKWRERGVQLSRLQGGGMPGPCCCTKPCNARCARLAWAGEGTAGAGAQAAPPTAPEPQSRWRPGCGIMLQPGAQR